MYASWPCPQPDGSPGEEMVLGFDKARSIAEGGSTAEDLRAFGRFLFELLVGRAPESGEVSASAHNAGVSEGIDTLITWCAAAKPSDDAKRLLELLEVLV